MSLRDLFPDTSHLDVADPDTLTEPPDELPPDPEAGEGELLSPPQWDEPNPDGTETRFTITTVADVGPDDFPGEDPAPKQLPEPTPLERAEALKAEGMALSEAGAGEDWNGRALAWLKGWLQSHAEYNPDTDNRNGPDPGAKRGRAWGPVTLRAIREGWLKRIGYTPRVNGRCAPGPVYKSLIFRSR